MNQGVPLIPRRIIQTGKTRRLSLLERASLANFRALNPDFELVYFDDADVEAFIDREFPQYRELYDRFPYRIQRFDFFRYLAVFRLGGFYFDLDVFLAKGLQDLTTLECVFPFEELTLNRFLRDRYRMDWEIGNYAFGATAGHPFLGALIDHCVRAQRDPAWADLMMKGIPSPFQTAFAVLNTTGPGMVTRTLAENPGIAASVTVLFPDDVCDEKHWHNFGDYGVHLMAASWRGGRSFLMRRLTHLWESRTRRRLMAQSRQLGARRTHPSMKLPSA